MHLLDFLAIADKGDIFCDFMFAFLYTNPLLKKKCTVKKERRCSQKEQSISFESKPLFKRDQNNFVVYLESASDPLNFS